MELEAFGKIELTYGRTDGQKEVQNCVQAWWLLPGKIQFTTLPPHHSNLLDFVFNY